MKYTLRAKLSLSYMLVVLISVFLTSVLTNLLLEKHFKEYVIKNQERKSKEIVSLISQQYKPGGRWNTDVIENIGMNALEQGMIIKVVDSSGKAIWDAMVYNRGLCHRMLEHMACNMTSRYPNWKGGYVEDKYPVTYNLSEVGRVEIGYYGPYYFNDNDLAFINTLNRLFIGVGMISLLSSLFIAAFMSKRLSTPISRVIEAAHKISKGYYQDRITEKSGIKEISQLTQTINDLAEVLEKQEMLRKRLTADVAHELRTPLATLQSHMEAMIDGVWEPDIDRIKSCHEEIVRISRLVGDLEKLAKYESESLILNKTRFDVSQLIRHIIRNFEIDFINKGLDIEFNGQEEIVFADKDKISQVIINLLSNALKYTPEGGRVEVKVESSGDVVNIIVKDTGEGISPEDLPYIFERFYRADKSRNRLTGGAGIGLTIAKAIVEAHKGTIRVNSRINEGTEFIVSLPKQVG
ncbi:signal transduction histidine kinase [Caldicoprobacter guelmensis]|uniref:sensor histidine kinase n=1 Tax=Caldicoprobacter guelmensis TaxID=1170224 RepID=UPI00195C91C8|nr:ATP-binding protein [Caldicoprobacter guelmensis]MBM7583123.1 signal transduction histidine kinase [Caldicoprobacter guelmensis]